MRISEARSYSQGIEFLVRCGYGNVVIRGKRNTDGTVFVELDDKFKKEKTKGKTLISIIVAMCAIPIAVLASKVESYINISLVGIELISIFWLAIILYIVYMKEQKDKEEMYRYHAAEHKALNYLEKHGRIPKTIDELRQMDKYYISCGTTLLCVAMLFVTMVFLVFAFVPYLALKIVSFAIATILILYLWANGKCNFIQKYFVLEPTNAELEVALETLKLYDHIIEFT